MYFVGVGPVLADVVGGECEGGGEDGSFELLDEGSGDEVVGYSDADGSFVIFE